RDDAVSEEALPAAEEDREDHQVVAIDQLVVHQGLEHIGAAVNLELGSVLLLEALDLRNDVALDEVRRPPVGALERGGDDVLGGPVQWASALFVAGVRPIGSEDVVGLAAE